MKLNFNIIKFLMLLSKKNSCYLRYLFISKENGKNNQWREPYLSLMGSFHVPRSHRDTFSDFCQYLRPKTDIMSFLVFYQRI